MMGQLEERGKRCKVGASSANLPAIIWPELWIVVDTLDRERLESITDPVSYAVQASSTRTAD